MAPSDPFNNNMQAAQVAQNKMLIIIFSLDLAIK